MENLENLQNGYNAMKERYNHLIEIENNFALSWLGLYKDVCVLEYRCNNIHNELYYYVQSLELQIRDKLESLSK